MTPRFLQLHYLTDYTGVLLNRDENGNAKRLPKGGVPRTRVSSQSLKYHIRRAGGEFALTNIAPDPVRTKELSGRRILEGVRANVPDADEDLMQMALAQLNTHLYGNRGNDDAQRTLLLFGEPEIKFLTTHLINIVRDNPEIDDAQKAIASLFAPSGGDAPNWRAFRASQAMPAGIIGAVFGRMNASDREANIEGALYVAHAFTVHAEQSEIDFFTAMEDLQRSQDGGAGHMGTTEINSGIFYLYACMDVPTLVSNTTGCHRDDWLNADRTIAAQASANIAALMATTSPGAKKGSTAPFSYAQAMIAEFGESQPRKLADAFTEPSEPTMSGALRKLKSQLEKFDQLYGTNETRRTMETGYDTDTTLTGIHRWINQTIMDGTQQ